MEKLISDAVFTSYLYTFNVSSNCRYSWCEGQPSVIISLLYKENSLFIPLCASYFLSFYENADKQLEEYKILFNCSNDGRTISNIPALVKTCLNYPGYNYFQCVVVNNELYYIHKGIILNRDKKPLFILGIETELPKNGSPMGEAHPVLLFSQELLKNYNDSLSKYLIRKFIPSVLSSDCYIHIHVHRMLDSYRSETLKVSVENIDKVVSFPQLISEDYDTVQTQCNKFLKSNVNKLFLD